MNSNHNTPMLGKGMERSLASPLAPPWLAGCLDLPLPGAFSIVRSLGEIADYPSPDVLNAYDERAS